MTYPEFVAVRDQAAAAARRVARLTPTVRDMRREIDRLRGADTGDPAALDRARADLRAFEQRFTDAAAEAGAAERAYRSALDAGPASLDPTVPLLLLPVRLETRIRARSDGLAGDELVVRLFPDDVHIHDHDPVLSAEEAEFGRHYWRQRWTVETDRADDLDAQLLALWHQLATALGATRAAWVARTLTPSNLPPVRGTDPSFPDLVGRSPGEGYAPRAEALPDRWIVRAWRNGALLGEARGGLIPRPLLMGPAPDPVDPSGPTGWMVDLDTALAAGMAVVLRPDVPAAIDRIDLVTAFGVRASSSPAESAALLRDLLDAHQFAPASTLDLVPQATPTNNTPAARAPVRADQSSERSGSVWADAPAGGRRSAPGDGSDADLLAAALGLPSRDPLGPADNDLFVLGRLEHADAVDQRDAQAMATVLWPATWGYYLRQFLTGVEGGVPAPDADLADWRRFVLETVRGRGPLPTLRVRAQPYGVLPVLPVDRWRAWPDRPDLLTAALTSVGGRAMAELFVGWDLDSAGGFTSAGRDTRLLPVHAAADGLAVAVGDVDGDGRPELIVLTPLLSGEVVCLVGSRFDELGVPTRWSAPVPVPGIPGRSAGPGAGVAVTTFGRKPAILVVTDQHPPAGDPEDVTTVVRVGIGVGVPNAVPDWSSPVTVPGRAAGMRLAGAAAGVLDASGELTLVVAFVRGPAPSEDLVYLVGRGLQPDGTVTGWSIPHPVPGLPPSGESVVDADVALADLDGNGRSSDLIIAACGSGGRVGWTAAFGLQTTGAVGRWIGIGELPLGAGGVAGLGVAAGPVGRSPTVTTATPTGLVNLLARARRTWQGSVDAVPRLGRTADPVDDLLDLFATEAVSQRVRLRGLLGTQVLGNMWVAAGRAPDLAVYASDLWKSAWTLPREWGLLDPTAPGADDPAGKPRLGRAAFEALAVPFDRPLVGDGATTPAPAQALRMASQAGPDELHLWSPGNDAPLLDHLVRHSTLQAWADAALAVRPPDAFPYEPPWVEPELLDLPDLTQKDPTLPILTPTSWRHLTNARMSPHDPIWPGEPLVKDVVAALLGRAERGDPLADLGAGGRRVIELAELRAQVDWLSSRPAAVLARVVGETLDVAAHRLDPWLTAIATERLRALRRAAPLGVSLGGFGLVMDLVRDSGPPSEGYLHAPSVGQAATAAVLRCGALTHAKDGIGDLLALNLSSRRVRLALELTRGVRAGQQLGSLLGYRVERALYEDPALGLARYLPALRQLAPLTAGKMTPVPVATAVDAVAAPVVVDGLALLRARATIPWGQAPAGADVVLPPAGSPDQVRIVAILDDLHEAVDAIGDLGVAEAVHQAVHGNPGAGGASLDVLSGGEVPPADPDVVRTARAGVGVTHRLLVALPDLTDPAAVDALKAWPGADRPMARAAPRLNAWAAMLLGDPGTTGWQAGWPGPDGPGADQPRADFTVADLGLCPLDLVAAAGTPRGADTTDPSDPAARGQLERLMARYAADHAPNGTAGQAVRLDLDPPALPAGRTAGELLELANAVRYLLAGARPAAAGDLTGPAAARPEPGHRTDQMAKAAADALNGLKAAKDSLRAPFAFADPAAARTALAAAYPAIPSTTFDRLDNLLDLPSHLDPAPGSAATDVPLPERTDDVRDALATLAGYGLDGAAPISPSGSTAGNRLVLTGQARTLAADATTRLRSAHDADGPPAVLGAVFGSSLPIIPDFIVPTPDALDAAIARRAAAGDASDLDVADWMDEAAQVRSGTARLANLRLLVDATGGAGTGLQVAQLPVAADDWWAARPVPNGRTLPAGIVALVLAGPAMDPAVPFAGLLIDEWVEVIPAATQDTAVVFHVDTPTARAPQTLLLACPADPSRRWDDDELEHVIRDTVELAKLRAVDASLGDAASPPVGHYLPAALLALSTGGDPHGDTVATTFPRP